MRSKKLSTKKGIPLLAMAPRAGLLGEIASAIRIKIEK
jgi:hypothetical protein